MAAHMRFHQSVSLPLNNRGQRQASNYYTKKRSFLDCMTPQCLPVLCGLKMPTVQLNIQYRIVPEIYELG